MDFDDMLKDAWQAQAVPAAQALLHRRVQRQRWRHRLLRALEVALTVIAVLLSVYYFCMDRKAKRSR